MQSQSSIHTVKNSRLLFQTTRRILAAHEQYEQFVLVLYGPGGWGKSVFAIKVLSQLYGKREMIEVDVGGGRTELQLGCTQPNWDAWKKHLGFLPGPLPNLQVPKSWGFTPPDWESSVDAALRTGKQQLCHVMDDAGAWWSKYRWHEEWAKRTSEEWDTIRSAFAGVVITTQDPRKLLTVLRAPHVYTGRISKYTGNRYQKDWRYARVYQGWLAPDLIKTGKRTVIKSDWFRKWLPNRTFAEYDPVRRWYTRILHERTREARLVYGITPATQEEMDREEGGQPIYAKSQ